MKRDPRDTPAEEPDGGKPHVRFWRGPGSGNRPGLLNKGFGARYRQLDAWIDERFQEMARQEPRGDMRGRLSDWLWQTWSKTPKAKRSPRWSLSLVAVGCASAALLVVGARALHVSANLAARVSATERTAGYAVVIGLEPVLVVSAGVTRTFQIGEPLPLGVALQSRGPAGSVLRIADRAELRIEPFTRVAIDPPTADADAIRVESGRIALEVQRAVKPFRVALAGGAADLEVHEGALGALVATGARWSVAVHRGETLALSGERRFRVTSGHAIGAAPARSPAVRPIPDALPLDAQVERSDRRSIVTGLSDLLALVTIDGHEVAVDAEGRFQKDLTFGASVASVRVTALDAAGHRIERWVAAPVQSGKGTAASAPSATARGTIAPPKPIDRVKPGGAPPPRDRPVEHDHPTEAEKLRIRGFNW